MQLAKFRHQNNENGVIDALRDIYNYYFEITGDSYIKTSHYEKFLVFDQKFFDLQSVALYNLSV